MSVVLSGIVFIVSPKILKFIFKLECEKVNFSEIFVYDNLTLPKRQCKEITFSEQCTESFCLEMKLFLSGQKSNCQLWCLLEG